MNEQSTDNFIDNYEQSQKQNHAQFLKQIKAEFYQLRDDEQRRRSRCEHNLLKPKPSAPIIREQLPLF